LASIGLILAFTQPAIADQTAFATTARDAFLQAKTNYQAHAGDIELTWKFARAAFDCADYATNNNERASLANEGINACRKALEHATNSAPLHYYLSLNLGQLARTKSLGALKLVGQMEREFNAARQLDEHINYAGPDRGLGLLYRDAPSFGSIGSRTKARDHLMRVVELAPNYPENRLLLAETLSRWGDNDRALEQVKALEKLWDAAHAQFQGEAWASSWDDWNDRLQKLKKHLEPDGKS
jgi:hypothetical protein